MKISRPLRILLALGLLFGVVKCVRAYWDSPVVASITMTPTESGLPVHQWAYQVPFQFDDQDSVSFEIRRRSVEIDPKSNPVMRSGFVITEQESEMTVSMSGVRAMVGNDQLSVATWLIELDGQDTSSLESNTWRVIGYVKIAGTSSTIVSQPDFCRGKRAGIAWEASPHWNGNELCVGRFQTRDDQRVYDYYCVLVASDQRNSQSR